jgi:hypothetical protein
MSAKEVVRIPSEEAEEFSQDSSFFAQKSQTFAALTTRRIRRARLATVDYASACMMANFSEATRRRSTVERQRHLGTEKEAMDRRIRT